MCANADRPLTLSLSIAATPQEGGLDRPGAPQDLPKFGESPTAEEKFLLPYIFAQ